MSYAIKDKLIHEHIQKEVVHITGNNSKSAKLDELSIIKIKYSCVVIACSVMLGQEHVGSVSTAEMLFRTNLLAFVGGGSFPRFDEKAGEELRILDTFVRL